MANLTKPKILRPKQVSIYLSISLTSFWRLVQRSELSRGSKINRNYLNIKLKITFFR